MMNKLTNTLLLTCLLAATQSAFAKVPGNIAIHIAETHYVHPVLLLNPYYNVWHTKGPLAEKAALPVLQNQFEHVQECEANSQADVVLLLEPHMFYNPQMQVFHAEFIASAYTNDGRPVTKIQKEAQQLGSIMVSPDNYMEKGYQKAIEKVVQDLAQDQQFLAVLNQSQPINAGDLCHKLNQLPNGRWYY